MLRSLCLTLAIAFYLPLYSQIPRNGTYTYSIAFQEWNGKSLGATCTVIIKGDSVKVIHNGSTNLTGKKGDILDQGILVQHSKTKKWIIAHARFEKYLKHISPCGPGPTIIDFKRKKWWTC